MQNHTWNKFSNIHFVACVDEVKGIGGTASLLYKIVSVWLMTHSAYFWHKSTDFPHAAAWGYPCLALSHLENI